MFDIDGVVADVRHRLHHLESTPKNWSAFFAGAAGDPALPEGVALALELSAEHDLVWLTGRPERLRRVTTDWLRNQSLPVEPLHMRGNRDFRPARQTKLAVVRELAAERTVAVVVDDDPAVVSVLKADGIAVLLADWVPYGEPLRQGQERDGRT
ncbi:MAG: hypothetical protein WCB04_04655 [Mycobacteriales bacterium]